MNGVDAYKSVGNTIGRNALTPGVPSLNQLLADEVALVRKIALHLQAKLPPSMEFDDLMQVGLIALIEAKNKFNASINDNFDAFASVKIRGAMIDLSRQSDWVPRHLPRTMRQINAARHELEQQFSRAVSDAELIAYMDMSDAEYYEAIKHNNSVALNSLESLYELDLQPADESSERQQEMMLNLDEVSAVIKLLKPKEQLVMSLYYVDELNLKEIAQVLDVSESRVCQVHSSIIQTIRQKLSLH